MERARAAVGSQRMSIAFIPLEEIASHHVLVNILLHAFPIERLGEAFVSPKDARVTSMFGIVELMQQSRSGWGRRNNRSAFIKQKPFKPQKIRVPLGLADIFLMEVHQIPVFFVGSSLKAGLFNVGRYLAILSWIPQIDIRACICFNWACVSSR